MNRHHKLKLFKIITIKHDYNVAMTFAMDVNC